MRNAKSDRRSQRSRELLSQALIALLGERRYDAITVQDIIDRANVGRSTFYAHYLDKEDLLVSEFARVLDLLTQQIGPSERAEPRRLLVLAPFFAHVQEHQHLYRALVRGGGIELILKTSRERFRSQIERRLQTLAPAGPPPGVPLGLVADYVAGAILSLMTGWLDGHLALTPGQLDELFHQLVLPGLRATLGRVPPGEGVAPESTAKSAESAKV